MAERALNDVAALIGFRVESGWSPALGTLAFAGSNLIACLWDDGLDATRTQVGPVPGGGVAAIGQYRIRCGARPAMFAGDVDVLQGVDEHGPVVALPTGDHDRQRPSLPINGVVDLRGQPAAGTSDPMPGRLKLASPGFLVIRQSPLCPAQGGRYWCRAGEHG